MHIIYNGKNKFLHPQMLEFEAGVPQTVYTFYKNIETSTTGIRIFLDHSMRCENIFQKMHFHNPFLSISKKQTVLQRLAHIDFVKNEKPLPKDFNKQLRGK